MKTSRRNWSPPVGGFVMQKAAYLAASRLAMYFSTDSVSTKIGLPRAVVFGRPLSSPLLYSRRTVSALSLNRSAASFTVNISDIITPILHHPTIVPYPPVNVKIDSG